MDNTPRTALKDIRSIDPLGDAADLLGLDSYKDDPAAGAVGMMIAHRKADLMRAVCSEHDDIYYRLDIDNCLRILRDEGFEVFAETKKKRDDYAFRPTAMQKMMGKTRKQIEDGSRSWTLWYPEYNLLGSVDSFVWSDTGAETLNSLHFGGQFISPYGDDDPAAKSMSNVTGHGSSGTVCVRKSDLCDIHLHSWSIRDGLRDFMTGLRNSGYTPVDQWVNRSGHEDNKLHPNLPEHIRNIVDANIPVLKVSELSLYGK